MKKQVKNDPASDTDDTNGTRSTAKNPYASISGLAGYFFIGTVFGLILTKSEVVSWFRIQEMFRFESFHMYGIIGSAIFVAGVSIQLIKWFDLRTIHGDPIEFPEKEWQQYRYWIGGLVFGLGWALLGACPGPIFALIGAGYPVILVALLSAVAGAWVYGALKPYLPH